MTQFAVGTVLADRYRLESLLGQGGMGSVWRAHHLRLNSPVAIKLIDPAIANHQETLDRFMREAQAAAALRSPHVVQTLDYGVHQNVPYIAMELMVGESLADRLERVGRLSPREAVRILTHVGRAVAKAHDRGIVHRDLKPDNVFLVHNDDEEIAKVLDFGIAKLTTSDLTTSSSTRTGTVMGTPYYMSPEQAEGTKTVDARTDIWAMGVIAFECITGVRPFEGTALGDVILKICSRPIPIPSEVGPSFPGFDAWFAKACARDLSVRFANVRDMTESLRALVTSTLETSSLGTGTGKAPAPPTGAPVVATHGDTGTLRGSRRAVVIGGAIAGIAAIAIAAVVGSGSDPEASGDDAATASTGGVESATSEPTPTAEPPRPEPVAAEPVRVEPTAPKKAPEEQEASSNPKPSLDPTPAPSAQPPSRKAVAVRPAKKPAPSVVKTPTPAAPQVVPAAKPAPVTAPKPAAPAPKPKKRLDERDYGF